MVGEQGLDQREGKSNISHMEEGPQVQTKGWSLHENDNENENLNDNKN